MRLIDADALMELYADRLTAVAERYSPDSSECGILSGAMKLLEIQPTIEERKKGKWILDDKSGRYRCSECLSVASRDDHGAEVLSDYCGVCGARMEKA